MGFETNTCRPGAGTRSRWLRCTALGPRCQFRLSGWGRPRGTGNDPRVAGEGWSFSGLEFVEDGPHVLGRLGRENYRRFTDRGARQ